MFTVGVNGPDYDLSRADALCRWRDQRAGPRAGLNPPNRHSADAARRETTVAAMPKRYGVKEKDLVVSHVVNMVLTGKLRSGIG